MESIFPYDERLCFWYFSQHFGDHHFTCLFLVKSLVTKQAILCTPIFIYDFQRQ